MAYTRPELPLHVSIALDDGTGVARWEDISDDVFYEDGVTVKRGSSHDTPELEVSRADMTLKNFTGKYVRLNPMSELYGKLHMDQPARVDDYVTTHSFLVDDTDGWATTDQGGAISLSGSGGTVANTNFTVSGGQGRMSLPFGTGTSGYRQVLFDDDIYFNCEVTGTFQFSVSDITGSTADINSALTAEVIVRATSATDFLMCRVVIFPNQTVQIGWRNVVGGVAVILSDVLTDIVYSGQKLTVCAGAHEDQLYAKIWEDGDAEPMDWHVDDSNGSGSVAGKVGFRAGRFASNTNANPVTVTWEDCSIRSPLLVGVVPEWPPRWDRSGRYSHTPIEIVGILRRLDSNKIPLQSVLRQTLPTIEGLVQYWPAEDKERSDSLASALDGYPAMTCAPDDGQTAPSFAAFSGFVASQPIPTVGKARWRGLVPSHTTTGVYKLRFLQHISSSGMDDGAIICQWWWTGGTLGWGEYYYATGGGCRLRLFAVDGSVAMDAGTFVFNMNDHLCRTSLEFTNTGGDLYWKISAPEQGNFSGGYNDGTLVGHTMGRMTDIRFAVGNPVVNYNDLAIGHVTVQTSNTPDSDFWFQFAGYEGERANERAARVCAENDIEFRLQYDHENLQEFHDVQMGPQELARPVDILESCAKAGGAAIYETKSIHNGISYRLAQQLQNQPVALQLDASLKELAGRLEPDEDPTQRYNDITVRRTDGSSFHVEQHEGSYAIELVGRRPKGTDEFNVRYDYYLADIAYFELIKSTVDEYTIATVETELANHSIRNDAAKSRKLQDIELFNRLQIINLQNRYIFHTVEQLVRGYTIVADQFQKRFSFNTIPGSPYLIVSDEDDEYNMLTSDTTTLVASLSTSATSFLIGQESTDARWDTTDPPGQLEIGGEVMDVVSVIDTVPGAPVVGTVAHADNANVSPGQPAGLVSGQVMALYVFCRNNLMGVTLSTAGWTLAADIGFIRMYLKTWNGSEAMPTVQISGGVAGNTVSAVIIRLPNVEWQFAAGSVGNASAQNITTATAYYGLLPNWIALNVGYKQDDFTSVAPLQGYTELLEASSTLGSDHGFVIDYKIGTDVAGIGSDSYVVTGGAAATGRGMVNIFGHRQTVNVTRAANQVVKTHSAGAAVTPLPRVILGPGQGDISNG